MLDSGAFSTTWKAAKVANRADDVMVHTITVKDLQTLSVTAMEQLPRVVSIRDEGRTVALLIPVRPATENARERFRRILAQAQAERSTMEQEILDREFGP